MTEPSTCPSCGADLHEDDVQCPACGLRRSEESPASTSLTGATRAFADPAPPGKGDDQPYVRQRQREGEEADGWLEVRRQLEEATRDEFEILGELGRGGMATVYLARDLALGRKVAIKVMAPGLLSGPGMVERFRQEAVTVANLHHPNVVTIHTVRVVRGLHFFVMQMVDGGSLEDVLQRPDPLPVALVQAILYQVGTGLAHAHRNGIIHRDIKPANVLLDGEGNAILTDFGIAKVTVATNLTQTGLTIGTPRYMSPEQCLAREVSGASDQYSLGVVAYEMLVGHTPFSGSSFEIMQAHTSAPVPGIRAQRPECPPHLEAAVLRMLAKDPSDRFPTVAEAIEAIGGYLPGPRDPLRLELVRLVRPDTAAPTVVAAPLGPMPPRSPSPPPATPSRGPRRRRLPLPYLLGGAIGLGVLVVLAVFLAQGWPGGEPSPVPAELPGVAAISFPNPAESLVVGATARVRARLQDAQGQGVAGLDVAWSSDDESVVAVEGFDDEAVVRGLTPGTAAVYASAGGMRESFQVVVSAPATAVRPEPEASAREDVEPVRLVRAVSVGQPTEPLMVGGSVVLRGTITAEPPGYMGAGGITWSSSNPSVASLSAFGGDSAVVALLGEGEATVSARADEIQGAVNLRVRPAPPSVTVSLSRTSVTFQAVLEGAAPPEQTVRVTVTGGANPFLGMVLYEGSARDWLRSGLGGGPGQEAVLTLRAEASGLAPGSYRARLPVEAGGQTREVEVRLEIAPKPVSTAVEPTPAAEREVGDLLSAYASAINTRNEGRARELYPSIPPDGIRDLMRIQESDIFQVIPLTGTLRAGSREGTLDIDVSAGIVPQTGAGQTRRMTYTVGRGDRGWYIVSVRAGG